jgi:hypothetical protein
MDEDVSGMRGFYLACALLWPLFFLMKTSRGR